ncbi:MAG: ABC transporter ATP-binding protein [Candidatus Dormibacteria bacterium]
MAELAARDRTGAEDTPRSPDPGLLRVERLVKDYGTVHAVRGIDLELRRGEILGFLGPNGAGKSTTIRCILDLLRPTSGRIAVFGMDPRRDGVAIRSRLSYVPGELRLPNRMSCGQVVTSIGRLRGGFDPRRRDQLAERLRLDLRRETRQLSSGNRRKLALLLAFLWTVELLVLDEPTSGLDPLMQHEFVGLVREARDAGASVFLSSHVLSEVQRTADRVVVLRAGRVVAQGTVEQLRGRARQRVEVWFDGAVPARVTEIPGLIDTRVEDHHFTAALAGPIRPLLAFLAAQPVTGMLVEEPDLEEAFLDLYEEAR